MNTVFEPSTIRNVGRHTGGEVSNVSQEAASASPRDHLEFGAKLLGFSGEVGDYAGVPDRIAASVPRTCGEQGVPPAVASAVGLDIIYVSRGTKASLENLRQWEALPPRGSIEWQQLVERRIRFISMAFALALTTIWMTWIVRGSPRIQLDIVMRLTLLLLILPALYGLSFFILDAVYGRLSGSTRRAKKYMDQVYPPSKRRTR